jgi:hypothetical protein
MRLPRITVLLANLATLILFVAVQQASAGVTIAGSTGDKRMITGMPVTTNRTAAVLKITFENKTPDTFLFLCAGTPGDFVEGKCGRQLSGQNSEAGVQLVIVDTNTLQGQSIYIVRAKGTPSREDSSFVFTIE